MGKPPSLLAAAPPPEVVEAREKALRLLLEDPSVDLDSLTDTDMWARGLTMADLYACRAFRYRQENPFGRHWEGVDPTKPWRGRAQLPLTPRQEDLLAVLRSAIEATGKSPTMKAMGEAMGVTTGRIKQLLDAMVRKRHLYIVGDAPGGYRIPAPRIPIPLAPSIIRLARCDELTLRMPPPTEALDYCRAIYELGPQPEESPMPDTPDPREAAFQTVLERKG